MIEFNEDEFLKRYKGTESFITAESRYYKAFLELLKDGALLDKIKFVNDELKIPPIKTFILYERNRGNGIFNERMTPVAKRGLGACFGYLYKVIYGNYESEQSWFNDKITGIKTASYFIKNKG